MQWSDFPLLVCTMHSCFFCVILHIKSVWLFSCLEQEYNICTVHHVFSTQNNSLLTKYNVLILCFVSLYSVLFKKYVTPSYKYPQSDLWHFEFLLITDFYFVGFFTNCKCNPHPFMCLTFMKSTLSKQLFQSNKPHLPVIIFDASSCLDHSDLYITHCLCEHSWPLFTYCSLYNIYF